MPKAHQPRTFTEARGLHGQLELSRDKVRIRREGLLARTKGRDKEIPIRQIASLQFRKAGLVTHGYVGFVLRGERGGFRASDEDIVQFHFWEGRRFEAIKRAIELQMENSEGN